MIQIELIQTIERYDIQENNHNLTLEVTICDMTSTVTGVLLDEDGEQASFSTKLKTKIKSMYPDIYFSE